MNIEFQTFEVPLPSEGLNYPNDCAFKSGVVKLKYGTSKEETILMDNQLIKKGTVLTELLKSLMVEKEDVNMLFPGDYNALMLAVRISMYGSDYDAEIQCPSCGRSNKVFIDLSKFENYKNTEDFLSGNFEYVSKFKNKYKYKILTTGELIEFENFISNMKKKNIPVNVIAEHFFRCIESVNDKKDKAELKTFFNNMPSIESREVREHILSNYPDIDMTQDFVCSYCGHEWETELPINVKFFWGTGPRQKRI